MHTNSIVCLSVVHLPVANHSFISEHNTYLSWYNYSNGYYRKDITMTDKQMQFITWLITTATDKCQSIEEVREMNEAIRKNAAGLQD